MDIAANLQTIRTKIAEAAERAGRDPASVQLMGVTKGQPAEKIRQAVDAGLTLFGENKVQEARLKIGQCPARLHWHMIGHLQSNKCRDAIQLFEMIQSVDSLKLAEELQKTAEKAARSLPILLEVNVAGEASKFGYPPARLLDELDQLNGFKRLEIHGLMSVPPWKPDPELVRPSFRKLRELKQQCEDRLGAPLAHLSMGMSQDYSVAVEEGATIVRIGTALFGARQSTVRTVAEPE